MSFPTSHPVDMQGLIHRAVFKTVIFDVVGCFRKLLDLQFFAFSTFFGTAGLGGFFSSIRLLSGLRLLLLVVYKRFI